MYTAKCTAGLGAFVNGPQYLLWDFFAFVVAIDRRMHSAHSFFFYFYHRYFPIEWSGLPHILTSCCTTL